MKRRLTAVVLTALNVEMAAVLKRLSSTNTKKVRGGTRYVVGTLEGKYIDWTIAVAEIGEGNIGAAVEATIAIREFGPDVILFVGIAGGLKTEIPHGSVVVADRVYHYQTGKSGATLLGRPVVLPTWHSLAQLVRELIRSEWTANDPRPLVVLKPIAAGERVISSVDSDDYRLIQERFNDAAAVDMESAGFYTAAERNNRLPAVVVRGISDMVLDKTAERDAEWQPRASENAAAFATALLQAVGPDDLALAAEATSYVAPQTELLARLPPNVVESLSVALDSDTPHAEHVLGTLTAGAPAEVTVSRLLDFYSVNATTVSQPLWVALGEFAAAHQLNRDAAVAFNAAGVMATEGGAAWFARAALAYAAGAAPGDADAELSKARQEFATLDQTTQTLVSVIEAAIANDAEAIVSAASDQQYDSPLIDLILMQALGSTGDLDAAIELGRRNLERANVQATGAGVAHVMGTLLLHRSESQGGAGSDVRDLLEAQELGLRVRDIRRPWGGPSADGVDLAAVAALKLGDYQTVLAYGLPAPAGDATEEEAADPRLINLTANAAIALRRFNLARDLIARIDSEPDRVLATIDCDIAEGTVNQTTTTRLLELLAQPSLTSQDETTQFRLYLQVADLGLPLPDLSGLKDRESAEIITAKAELKSGAPDAAIPRLRRLVSPRGRAFLVNALVDLGRTDEAINVLRDSADRFGDSSYRYRAALLLGSVGRLHEARNEAQAALAVTRSGSRLAGKLRAVLVEANLRLRNWAEVVNQARAALDEGLDTADTRWALIWAQFSLRNLADARTAFRESRLKPRDEDDAILITQLLRTGPEEEGAVLELLDLADEYSGSEQVTAAVVMSVMEVARQLQLPESVRERLTSLSNAFFETWPNSHILYRIDASDINNLIDFIRKTLEPSTTQLQSIATRVELGQLPYGMLAAAAGRSVAEALVKVAAGSISSGEVDAAVRSQEDQIALAAANQNVVADTSAMIGVARTGIDPSTVASFFAAVSTTTATLDDAFIASDALRLRSTSTMGWDPRQGRPTLTEVDPAVADTWARDAEQLVDRIKLTNIRAPSDTERDPRLTANVVLDPVKLAKELGLPVWSDERTIRILARNEGVPAFGTMSVLDAMRSAQLITEDQLTAAALSFARNGYVDFGTDPTVFVELAEEESWRGILGGRLLSRPSAWLDAPVALRAFQLAVSKAMQTDPSAIAQWAFSAAMGAARSSAGRTNRCGVIPIIALSGLASTGLAPEAFKHILLGVRAAAEQLNCNDPLDGAANMLAEALRQNVPESGTGQNESIAAQNFVRAIQDLEPADRGRAFAIFLRGKQ